MAKVTTPPQGKLPIDPQVIPDWMRHNIPAVPPDYDPDEDPARCYRINVQYVGFLVALCSYYAWPDAFQGDQATRELAAARFRNLQVLLMTGNVPCVEDDLYLLRQNPQNFCQLQQSIDGGITWTLAFDFSLCKPGATVPSRIELTNYWVHIQTWIDNEVTTYNSSPSTYAPNMVYDTSSDDDIRDQAMCLAWFIFLATMANILADEAAQQGGFLDYLADFAAAASKGLKLTSIALEFISLTGLGYVAPELIAGAVAAGVIADELAKLGEDPDVEGLTDQETIRAIQCYAMGIFGGATPTFANFQTVFDGVDTLGLSDDINTMLQDLVAEVKVYVEFLNICNNAFDLIDAGASYACPCGEDAYTRDFTAASGSDPDTVYGQGPWSVPASNAGCGNYVEGVGYNWGEETTGDFTRHGGVNIRAAAVSGTVLAVEVDYNLAAGHYTGTGEVCYISYGGEFRWWYVADNPFGNDQTIRFDHTAVLSGEPITVGVFNTVDNSPPYTYNGSSLIKRIRIFTADGEPSGY